MSRNSRAKDENGVKIKIKKFRCDAGENCGTYYSTKQVMRDHIENIHETKKVKCEKCFCLISTYRSYSIKGTPIPRN